MIELTSRSFSCSDGVDRRSFLRVGMLGLGSLTLPTILALRAQAGVHQRETSVIFIKLASGQKFLRRAGFERFSKQSRPDSVNMIASGNDALARSSRLPLLAHEQRW